MKGPSVMDIKMCCIKVWILGLELHSLRVDMVSGTQLASCGQPAQALQYCISHLSKGLVKGPSYNPFKALSGEPDPC